LAGGAGWLSAHYLDAAALEAWGWRLPFAAGLVIGPLGVYMRMKLIESQVFAQAQQIRLGRRMPLIESLRYHKRRLLVGFGLVLGGTATVYVMFLFMPIYVTRTLRLDLQTAFLAPMAAGATLAACCPLGGALSDRLGRKPVMLVAVVLFLVGLLPLFLWLNLPGDGAGKLIATEVVLGVLMAGYLGPLSTTMAELFPTHLRSTAVSLAYNLGVALFGGFAPLIVAWLIDRMGTSLAPAYYVMTALAISAVAILCLPSRINLDDRADLPAT
jgi:MFS family permease